MEDWELTNHTKFPHFMMEKYMWKVYYEEIGVTTLETKEWVYGVKQSRLLNLLLVPHYHHTPVNTICVHHLPTLVHDRCLWLGETIPIMDMLIHIIIWLPSKAQT